MLLEQHSSMAAYIDLRLLGRPGSSHSLNLIQKWGIRFSASFALSTGQVPGVRSSCTTARGRGRTLQLDAGVQVG